MCGSDPNETLEKGDILTGRKKGTAERIFTLENLKTQIAANCVAAVSASEESMANQGLKGISELMDKSFAALTHEESLRKIQMATELLTESVTTQANTAKIVLDNLKSETKKALSNEKQNRVSEMAEEYGVPTKNLNFLKGKLIPMLPKAFKDLDISPETICNQMDMNKE